MESTLSLSLDSFNFQNNFTKEILLLYCVIDEAAKNMGRQLLLQGHVTPI